MLEQLKEVWYRVVIVQVASMDVLRRRVNHPIDQDHSSTGQGFSQPRVTFPAVRIHCDDDLAVQKRIDVLRLNA